MARNTFEQILKSKDKLVTKTNGANGSLSRLFRLILLDLDINLSRFGSLLEDYIHDVRHAVPDTKKDQTSTRGNLVKEFAKEQMTWKVFCKALRFLQIVKIDFTVTAYHPNGEKTYHSVPVRFGRRRDTVAFNEALEQTEEHEDVQYVQCLDQDDESKENDEL